MQEESVAVIDPESQDADSDARPSTSASEL